jgi:hypothetical protein
MGSPAKANRGGVQCVAQIADALSQSHPSDHNCAAFVNVAKTLLQKAFGSKRPKHYAQVDSSKAA